MSFGDIRLFSEWVFFGDQSAASYAVPDSRQIAIARILCELKK